MPLKTSIFGAALAILLLVTGGARAADPSEQRSYVVELITPGGPLPAVCELQRVRGAWSAHFKNAQSVYVSDDVSVEAERAGLWTVRRVRIGLLGEDSVLEWTEIDRGRDELARGSGRWSKRRHGEVHELPAIVRGIDDIAYAPIAGGLGVTPERFTPIERAPLGETGDGESAFAGKWRVEFADEEDPAVGDFSVDADGMASGTFNTTTGDYRYLAGRVDGDVLRLSTFDGRDSYLFHARALADGSLAGDFWSGSWWHDTWTASRDEGAAVNDGFARTKWTGDKPLDELVFRTLDGEPRSLASALDELDAGGGRATLLLVFGSWCPNCGDAVEYLAQLQREHAGRGLRVLGLAFEYTGDFAHDAEQVRLHQQRSGADWPVLVAGLSDKKKASAALPVLDRVRAFPTVVFLDADREAVGVYSGFAGPATGEAHDELREQWGAVIERLLGGAP